MLLWKDDKELYLLARKKLFTALVGDILDKMGYLHQFLPPGIKPVGADMVLIGRAMPVLDVDVCSEIVEKTRNPIIQKPFGMMFEALDDLKEDEVYICTGSSNPYALWGGLMSVRAMKLKSAGAVVNGYSRDTNEISRLKFPTYSKGTYAQDQGPRGKVVDFRIPIEWGGVNINPGDIIFGDLDGVLVIPHEIEIEAFTGALEKSRGEKKVLKVLRDGMSTVEAFNKYGIM